MSVGRRRRRRGAFVRSFVRWSDPVTPIRYRMRRYFKFFLAQTTALNEKKILDKLSPILRAEVGVHSEPFLFLFHRL